MVKPVCIQDTLLARRVLTEGRWGLSPGDRLTAGGGGSGGGGWWGGAAACKHARHRRDTRLHAYKGQDGGSVAGGRRYIFDFLP